MEEMTIKDLRKYFEVLREAQRRIGIRKENRKILTSLEELKTFMLLDVTFMFSYDREELREWLNSDNDALNAYWRTDGTRCRLPGRPLKRETGLWSLDGTPPQDEPGNRYI